MNIGDVRVTESPIDRDRVRLSATVEYDTGPTRREEYWFDVPGAHAHELSSSGNPWLAALLPLAAFTGEPLRVHLPVDRPLLENAARLVRIWRAWHPGLREVSVDAAMTPDTPTGRPPRAAAFFSGGADSFFTVLRDREAAPPAERVPIDDLITVWGFDVPLRDHQAFGRLRERNRDVARAVGRSPIDVATNLRTTRWHTAPWSSLTHGAGLAGIALALERRFHTIYIAGGGGYRGLHPWGSHAVTDPLFSTSCTAIVYDAVTWLRTEKIQWIADHPVVRRALRVCYESGSDENCGRCNKCLRTMLTLELCGALASSSAFPRNTIELGRVARIDCSHFADFRELQDIRRLAVDRGRADVVAALDRSARRSRRRSIVRAGVLALRHPWLVIRKRLLMRRPPLES